MDYSDYYNAMLAALTEHAKLLEENPPRVAPGMLPIVPFEAENADDERVTAIGVVANSLHDCLDFVVLKELEDGEIIPTTEGSLWRIAGAAVKLRPAPPGA